MATTGTGQIRDCCLAGGILSGEPKGSMAEFNGGLKYYVVEGKGETKDKAIVVAVDIFGLTVPNPKLIADAISERTGLTVYVPDILEGDGAPAHKLSLVEKPLAKESLFTRVYAILKMVSSFVVFVGPAFMYRHRDGVVIPLMTNFCKTLKEEKGVKRIGMVGYCFGGALDTKMASGDLLDVVVCAHPGTVGLADFEKIHQPFALIQAEEDFSFDMIKKTVLPLLERKKANGLAVEVFFHPGTTHGFAARPKMDDDLIKREFEKATTETVDFFLAHL